MAETGDLFGAAAPVTTRRAGGRVWLPGEVRRQVRAIRAAGGTILEVAAALGICETTARTRLLDELGVGPRGPGRPTWSPPLGADELAEQLAADGAATAEIAIAFGCTPPTLRKHLADALARGRAARKRAR